MKWISILPLFLFLLGCYSASEENEIDALVWKYLLDKYSSPGSDHLSAQDVASLVKNLQKCDGPKKFKGRKEVKNKCTVPGLVQDEQVFQNLSSVEKISHRILYLADNPECCDSNLVSVPAQNHFQQPLTQSLNSTKNVVNSDKKPREKPSSGEVWGYGILCVTLISICSLAGVSVMPFMKKEFYKHLLTTLVGLAVGSLTGSAVFHLIPQAFQLGDSDPTHNYLYISLMVCGGVWLFFMLERILKFIMEYKDRTDKNWHREKLSSIISSTSPENSAISMLVENGNCVKLSDSDHRNGISIPCATIHSEPEVVYECQEQAIKASFGHQERPRLTSFHDHSIKFEQGKDSVIATVAYMIIFGDGLHNFIDGLSIGAAFNESILTGVSISMAVFCEELPHELGDFAVLLNAGMSMRQALTYNFLSACTCYIGMAVGILLGEIQASTYIFAFAGGMFLYIALVDMVPEMNETAEESGKVSVKKGMWALFLQNVGMFSGITALFLLAKYQDQITF